MVKGRDELKRRFAKIPSYIAAEVRDQLEKEAIKIVNEMNSIKPIPEIEIDWTWGDAPAGGLSIGKVRGREFGKISITIYATARTEDGLFPAIARWFEFSTAERFTKSGASRGRIVASPYFYPIIRANKARVAGNVGRAVGRGLKKAAKA